MTTATAGKKYTTSGLVCATLNLIQRTRDLWFYAQVVIKTVNEIISRCCFPEDGTDLFISACRTCSSRIFTPSTNQIVNLWLCRCRSRH